MNNDLCNLCMLALTLCTGAAAGILFKKLKMPAGYMIGAFVGVCVLSCLAGVSWVPASTRSVVQVVAGAFVGCAVERGDLNRLRHMGGAVFAVIGSCLVVMLVAGACIYAASPLDLTTALMCVVPGGVNDTPIVAADMGADAPAVAVLQLVRQVMGVAVLPMAIAAFDRMCVRRGFSDGEVRLPEDAAGRRRSLQCSRTATFAVLTASAVAGIIGRATHVPGMTFTFSVAAALVMKLGFDLAYIPKWVKNCCQVIAGCYLGTLMTPEGVLALTQLVIPALIVVAFYTVNCFVTGTLIRHCFGYTRKEGMLMASPAGASDMALIMDDMGIANTDVVIMQVIRATVVMGLFPQIVNVICGLLGG